MQGSKSNKKKHKILFAQRNLKLQKKIMLQLEYAKNFFINDQLTTAVQWNKLTRNNAGVGL